MKRVITGLMLVVLLAGCSSMRVSTDFSEAADFMQFKTFQYKETDFTVATANPLVHARIVEAIRHGIVESGLSEVESDPDVYVSYYGSMSQEIRLNTTSTGYSWGSSRHWHGHGMGLSTATTTSHTITTGHLLIDIWDAQENILVWRGQVSDTLSGSPGQDADRINRGIASVLSEFPPR